MKTVFLAILSLIAGLAPLTLLAQQLTAAPKQLLVQLTSRQALNNFINQRRLLYENVRILSERKNIVLIDLPDAQMATQQYAQLSRMPGILHVVYNWPLYARQGENRPNDPLYAQQWNLEKVGLPGIWDLTQGGQTPCGDTIVIAVFDFGFDFEHDDMQGILWANKGEIPNNGFDDDGNGYVDDYWGLNLDKGNDRHDIAFDYHGNAVSSIIAANTNNGIGMAGAAWNTKLLMVSSKDKDQALAIEAFEYIYQLRKRYNETNGAEGAYVVAVNNSWGTADATEEEFMLMCDMFNDLGEVGILSVGATENNQKNTDVFPDIPGDCSSDYLIVVTSTNRNDELGVAAFGKTKVDLAAPGEGVVVANFDSDYTTNSGTSFAAPLVAGAIGLLYSIDEADFCDDARISPTETILNIKRYLLDGVTQTAFLRDRTVSGGRLNLDNTFRMATSVRQVPTLSLEVYPNPVADRIHLVSHQLLREVRLSVYDFAGRLVWSADFPTIDHENLVIETARWPAGGYILQLRSNENTGQVQFLKY